MKSINNEIHIVNYSPSAVRSVAAGGLAALRSNRTIVSLADGRTPGVVAGSGIYGRQRPAYYRPLFSKLISGGHIMQLLDADIDTNVLIRNIRRAARAYKDCIALTFLRSIYSQADFVMEGAA
jgi:hypothetical protein